MEIFLKLGFFLLIILVSAISQYLKERPKKRRRPVMDDGRPLPPRPQANPRPVAEAAPKPNAGGGLEAEIEDFLRQVTGQPTATPPATASPRPATAAEPQEAAVFIEPEVLEPDVVIESPLTSNPNESVAEHVQQHIRQGGLESRNANLADVIENRDEAMESHLHSVFDHKLGALDKSSLDAEKVSRKTSLSAADILQSFQSPDDIRKAIILKEILSPKEWN